MKTTRQESPRRAERRAGGGSTHNKREITPSTLPGQPIRHKFNLFESSI